MEDPRERFSPFRMGGPSGGDEGGKSPTFERAMQSFTPKNFTKDATVVATKARETVVKAFSGKSIVLLLTVIFAAAVLAFVAYFLFNMLYRKIKNQQSYTITATNTPLLLTQMTDCVDGSKIPNMTANGQRMTMAFWIYVNNVDSAGTYRYIIRRSNQPDAISGASPLVFFDKDQPNKLYVRIPKSGWPSNISKQQPRMYQDLWTKINGVATEVTLENEIDGTQGMVYNSKADCEAGVNGAQAIPNQGICIGYVPIQRWVHVAVVVNELDTGGTITAYLDGQQVKQLNNTGTNYMLASSGDVYIGDSGFYACEGLLSKLQFFNYDLNALDVYTIYRNGPSTGMNFLGLGRYGVRSPVYQLPS